MTAFPALRKLVCWSCLLSWQLLRPAPAAEPWTHPLKKQGYLGSPLVEVTPLVWQGRLYRLENQQSFWDHPGSKPGERFHDDEVRIRDVQANKVVSVALRNHAFATALVWQQRVYVFAGNYGRDKPWRQITDLTMTSSADLVEWTAPKTVLTAEPGEHLFNCAVCRGRDGFVMLYESDDPKYTPFTFKYAASSDLATWRRIPDSFYGREKYVGGPALYFEGDWYYTLYLQALGENRYETRVARSRDLLRWREAPAGRPFVTFDPARGNLPLRPTAARETNASDAELCYFDGRTIVYFTGSDQQVAGDLQWATFEGTPRQLLEHYFAPDGTAPQAPSRAADSP